MQTSPRFEQLRVAAINTHSELHRGDIENNFVNEIAIKAIIGEAGMEEVPSENVIGLFDTQLHSDSGKGPFHTGHGMNHLLGHHNLVQGPSHRNKSTLIWGYQMAKNWSQAVDQNLGNDLVGDIAQTNMAVIFDRSRGFLFWDKDDSGFIDARIQSPLDKEVNDSGTEVLLYYVP